MTSNGTQFTITHEILTGVARDRRWPDVVVGSPARFSKFAFVLVCYITKHLMTGPLGNSHEVLKWYYDQNIISFFSSDFESVFA